MYEQRTILSTHTSAMNDDKTLCTECYLFFAVCSTDLSR